MRRTVSGRLFLGGHSYGGRQSSMLCAEEPDLVSGLLLLSYPLHPPRKPEQQRTQHLPDLRTPTLFVQGTRDPFGSIAELSKRSEDDSRENEAVDSRRRRSRSGIQRKSNARRTAADLSEFTQVLEVSCNVFCYGPNPHKLET